MVSLAEELPYAAVVDTDKLPATCSYCFAHYKSPTEAAEELTTCSSCNFIKYCSTRDCVKKDILHKEECQFLRNVASCPDVKARIVCRLIIRWIIQKDGGFRAYNGRTFADLMDHKEEMKNDPKKVEFMENFYKTMELYMGNEVLPTEEVVWSIYGKYAVNSISVMSHSSNSYRLGTAIYIGISGHDHSCRPDCHLIHFGSKIALRAMDPDTKYSLDLKISYIAENLPTAYRKKKLKDTWYFDCNCEYCQDKERDLLTRSGRSLCCEDEVLLPRENEPLICSKCRNESTRTLAEINGGNTILTKFLNEKDTTQLIQKMQPSDVEMYATLYNKMSLILSPYNLYLFNLAGFVSVLSLHLKRVDYAQQFTLARKKAIDKLFPSGFDQATYLMLISLFSMTKGEEQAVNDVKEALDFLKLYYGPDHPQTIEFKGYFDRMKKKSKQMKVKMGKSSKK